MMDLLRIELLSDYSNLTNHILLSGLLQSDIRLTTHLTRNIDNKNGATTN